MLQRPPSRADSARSVPASASGSGSAASPSLHAIPSPALSATRGVSLDGSSGGADAGPGALSQLASAALAQSIDQYRTAIQATPTPELQLEFAHFLIHTAVPECPDIARQLRAEATKMTKKAASAGTSACLADAQFFLAELYETGAASDKDKPQYDKAFTMYVKAAKHAHMEAAYRVAVYYENGRGTGKSGTRALQFYQKAGALGHPGACYRLGMAELHGELGQVINARNGIKWLKHSATNATPEHCEGLYELAVLHETGIEHVVFIDHEYAVSLLQQAATLGHVKAMYRLGSYHEHGNHVAKNPSTSFAYFQAAAERGHPDSMFGVASWYLTGNREASVPQSDELAFEWMKKAAEAGLIKALFALAYLYEEGIGTQENLALAKDWYEKALAKGDKRAAPRLVAIKQLLERERGGSDAAAERRRARAGKKRKVPKELMAGGAIGHSPAGSVSGGSDRGTPPGSVSGVRGGAQPRRAQGPGHQHQQQPREAPPKKMTAAEREAEREKIRRERTGEDACVIM